MNIYPAPLTNSPDELSAQLNKLQPFYKHYQIDIADGIYVPNTTTQLKDMPDVFAHCTFDLSTISSDFHLMVKDYIKELEQIITLTKLIKVKTIFIHFSLHPNYENLIANYPQFSFGLVTNPDDSIDELSKKYDLKNIPFMQIMTVVPGFQGKPFLKEELQKIDQLRSAGFKGQIILDGGVNDQTMPVILNRENKPNGVGIGSYLSKADNVEERVAILNQLLTQENNH